MSNSSLKAECAVCPPSNKVTTMLEIAISYCNRIYARLPLKVMGVAEIKIKIIVLPLVMPPVPTFGAPTLASSVPEGEGHYPALSGTIKGVPKFRFNTCVPFPEKHHVINFLTLRILSQAPARRSSGVNQQSYDNFSNWISDSDSPSRNTSETKYSGSKTFKLNFEKVPLLLNCPTVSSEEFVTDDDNERTVLIMADNGILEFVQSSENILDADSNEEN
ncbi:hypothetical protein TNCV_4534501 [Trichonephila clavipes]|nr:hypothetical protein TNCV_4534501 [Trichonephila clavipes]